MSTTVDERVVEMRFDNKQFESNVRTSMSTIDKLKAKLNFGNASKSLEGLNKASKNVNLSGLSGAIDTVHAKFSAMEVIGITALSNITNSAVNAGKRIVSALTIDPVKTGFQEYETQINAVQTILANTQHNGTTIDQVNAALDELNKYADLTIYNFTEMTRNIGTFTAAGIDLDTSVNAIQGIANLAAVSGSTSQQASTAMYQLSQALATGTVKLMDWNSVVNAGMGGKVFQDALTETSEKLGTGAKAAIEAQGSFRESLQTGWLTSQVLTETLKKFTTSGANEYVAEYTGLSKEAVEAALENAKANGDEATAIDRAAEALANKSGKNKEEIKSVLQMAQTAEDAATKVKTFTQLWDVLKEAVQSGWAQTFRLIFGDFEEAKALFTPISDFLIGIITKLSDTRNKILEGALGSPFGKLIESVKGANDSIKNAVDTIKDYGAVVDEIINGKWGNGQERWDKLTEAGYDWAHAQNLVNEKLDNGVRHATEYKEATEGVNETQSKSIEQLAEMSDAQLKQADYTDEQIGALRELEKQAEKLGIPLGELVEKADELDGRTLLINSFKNAGQGLVQVITAIRDAWREAFWGDASEDEIIQKKSERIYNLIAAIHKFSTSLKMSDETADKVKRTFKGLFAILELISTIAGGALKFAFEVVKEILGMFSLNILDVTAKVGDAVVAFRDWVEEHGLIAKAAQLAAKVIVKMVTAIADFVNAAKELPIVQKIFGAISKTFSTISGVISNFIDNLGSLTFEDIKTGFITIGEAIHSAFSGLFDGVPGDLLSGFVGGLWDGITGVVNAIINIGSKILEAFRNVLGIHSPSTETKEDGKNFVLGFIEGIGEFISNAIGAVRDFVTKILDELNIDWGTVFAGGLGVGFIVVVKNLLDTLNTLASPLEGLGDLFSGAGEVMSKSAKGIGKTLKSFSKVLNGISWDLKAKALKNIAISIAILVGAIVALSFVDTGKIWNAVGVIAVLAVILVGLAFAMDKMTKASISIGEKGPQLNGLKSGLIAIGIALLLLAATVKMIGTMNPDQAKQGFIGLAGLIVAVAAVFLAFGTFVKGKSAQNIEGAGKMIRKLATTLLVLAVVIKLVGMLKPEEMIKGGIFMAAFVAFVWALGAVTKTAGKNVDKVGKMVRNISIAMLLMVGVIKLIGMLKPEEMIKGAAFAAAFVLFVGALVAVTKIGKDDQIAKVGGIVMSISFAMLLMAGTIKLIATMSWGGLIKGAVGIAAFGAIIYALLTMVKKIGPQAPKLAGTILAMAAAIAIMAGVAVLLSLISIPGLIKGIAAVGMLGLIVAGMTKATKGASDVKGTMIGMAVAIGIMAAAIIALSFIKPEKLAGATAALAILMGMFALMSRMAGYAKRAMKSLIVMGGVLVVMAGVLYLLSTLEVESVLGVAAALSLLLLSMSATFAILGTFGGLATTALIGAAGMMGVIAIIGGISLAIGGLMSLIPQEKIEQWKTGLQNFMDFIVILAGGLGEALGAFIGGALSGIMSGLPAIGESLSLFMLNLTPFLNGIKMVDASMLEGVGVLTATIIALTVAELINGIASILSFGSSLADLGTELSLFMVNLTPFLLGASTIDPAIMAGVKSLAEAILLLTAAEMLDSIPLIGDVDFEGFAEKLVTFGKALVDFSNIVTGKINEEAVTAAANAGLLMAKLQSSIPRSGGWVQDILGEKDMGKFSEGIVSFANAIVEFSNAVAGGINEEAIEAAVNAGTLMSELQNSIPKSGGWVQDILGEKDMVAFGEGITAFGEAIVEFSKVVSAEGAINQDAIEAAVNAGTLMTELQNSIPKSGGWVQDIMGSEDLAAFGEGIKAFGESIITFSETVAGGINEDAVTAAANAGTIMANLQEAIPTDKWFDGRVNLDDFGSTITKFGEHLVDYSDTVVDVDTDATGKSLDIADTLVSLANKLVDLDTSGIESFKVKKIGTAMKDYSDEVKDIKTETVASSVTSANKLVAFINSVKNLDSSGISNFNVADIGKSMKKYSDEVSGMNVLTVSASIVTANKLITLIKNMTGLNTDGVSSFKSAIETLGSTNFEAVEKSFNGSASKMTNVGGKMVEFISKGFKSKQTTLITTVKDSITKSITIVKGAAMLFMSSGAMLATKLAAGINNKKTLISSSISRPLSGAVGGIRAFYGDFYDAGEYLVIGFANGIQSKTYLARARAKAMANAAKVAAERALDENSPSKEFYKIGAFAGQGFVNALGDYERKSYKASSEMAESAKTGLGKAISKVRSLIEGGMDTQPTIRPVVDLSAVESGAAAIGSMLNLNPSVGMMSNIGSINRLMSRNQNGTNADVVSAINKLRKGLDNVGNTSYNINGITYDSGSDVTDAIETLVRAAKIGGRA